MSELIGALACALATGPAGARWLRVAQREHYLPGAVVRFAWRWWCGGPLAPVMAAAAVAAAGLSFRYPWTALATAALVVAGPPFLGVRGRSAPLAFTRRLRLLAGVWVVLQGVIVLVGALAGRAAAVAALGACAVPLVVDVACTLLSPVERRLVAPFVRAARDRLAQVHPVVVAITGSFGKTSTKNHVAHLLAGARAVVASPASFNNRVGLARAVNEHLAPGTDVFVAEMGTYGKGEIAELCTWCPPEVAVITAIGPVHLERFKTEDAIVEAKAEIAGPARTVVLNVDDPRLAALAERLAVAGKTVLRCAVADGAADIRIEAGDHGEARLLVHGVVVGDTVTVPSAVQLTNLACAVGVVVALGLPPATAWARVPDLPAVASRLTSSRASSGIVVIDDTFNSNPSGARAALAQLAEVHGATRRVVVTPGMVELGPRQFAENRSFAAAMRGVATDLVIVGRTNQRALRAGASAVEATGPGPDDGDGAGRRSGQLDVRCVRTREQAVSWVRIRLTAGDAVLYENDLPDHYR